MLQLVQIHTMRNIYRSLLLLLIIAGATQKELARQVRYLKVENQILRSKLPARVPVTEKERNRLVRFAGKLGRALNEIVTIVHPDTSSLKVWLFFPRKQAASTINEAE
jgi:putative transposase